MAFTYTPKIADCAGYKTVTGTYANTAGSTGGAVVTGLSNIFHANFSSATSTPSSVVTLSGGTMTLTTTANQTGTFMAIGV